MGNLVCKLTAKMTIDLSQIADAEELLRPLLLRAGCSDASRIGLGVMELRFPLPDWPLPPAAVPEE